MKTILFLLFPILFLNLSCQNKESTNIESTLKTEESIQDDFKTDFIANSFDFPVGKPNANGYYNAQKFKENAHLGDDWNAVTGGNSDLGDPIYAVANGYVKFAKDIKGGWGNVIRIEHKLPNGQMIESLYAHCDEIFVNKNQWVKKGQQIGTIGNAHGLYYAHLHLEIRDDTTMDIGGGYSDNTKGYLNPTEFIKKHR